MEIRKATNDDLPALLALFAAARSFMAAQGNPGQWGNDYPPPELLKEDISKQGSFVCLHEGKIAASFALLPGPDPDYARLKSGAWRNDSPYFALHRVAAAGAPKDRDLRGAVVPGAMPQHSRRHPPRQHAHAGAVPKMRLFAGGHPDPAHRRRSPGLPLCAARGRRKTGKFQPKIFSILIHPNDQRRTP